MLNGKYDVFFPETSWKPMFEFLATPEADKVKYYVFSRPRRGTALLGAFGVVGHLHQTVSQHDEPLHFVLFDIRFSSSLCLRLRALSKTGLTSRFLPLCCSPQWRWSLRFAWVRGSIWRRSTTRTRRRASLRRRKPTAGHPIELGAAHPGIDPTIAVTKDNPHEMILEDVLPEIEEALGQGDVRGVRKVHSSPEEENEFLRNYLKKAGGHSRTRRR